MLCDDSELSAVSSSDVSKRYLGPSTSEITGDSAAKKSESHKELPGILPDVTKNRDSCLIHHDIVGRRYSLATVCHSIA